MQITSDSSKLLTPTRGPNLREPGFAAARSGGPRLILEGAHSEPARSSERDIQQDKSALAVRRRAAHNQHLSVLKLGVGQPSRSLHLRFHRKRCFEVANCVIPALERCG